MTEETEKNVTNYAVVFTAMQPVENHAVMPYEGTLDEARAELIKRLVESFGVGNFVLTSIFPIATPEEAAALEGEDIEHKWVQPKETVH